VWKGDTAGIALEGELDLAGSPCVRQALVDAINDGAGRVAVDLSSLSFVDSTGLGVLVGAYKRARSFDIEFVLVNPTRAVARVFEIAGLDRVMPIERTA
jgi:anti-sigma B factor antagonist